MRRTSDILHQAYRVLAEVTAQPLERLRQTFDEYITKNPPWDPKNNRPHTPDTAIQDWVTGVTPFLQAVYPSVPFERYQFEPHTRGLDEYNDVGELLKAVMALHTQAKYNTTTLLNRIDQDDLAEAMKKSEAQAETLRRDLENQFAQGRGVRADGTFGVMPGHTPVTTPSLTPQPFPTTSTTATDTQGQADSPPRSRWRELLWGRTAALTDDVLHGLDSEFSAWAEENGKTNPYDGRFGDVHRGPIGYWPNIEGFMQERYPAAYRGLTNGMEDVQPILEIDDDAEIPQWLGPNAVRYETGPEAIAQHGYDPKEIAAAMLALHSASHPGRGEEWRSKDVSRLHDIAQKRHQMQRDYDSRPRSAARVLAEATALLSSPSVTDVLSDWEKQRGAPQSDTINTDKCKDCGGLGFDVITGDACPSCGSLGSFIPQDVQDRISPHADKLEDALYNEFMEWWPDSEAAQTRDPVTSGTQWTRNPDEPITHWLNVEDFLRERYPEAATGSQYGGEQAGPLMERRIRNEDLPSPEWMEARGYTGHGNVLTQLMLNLHNKHNGRDWRSTDDKRKYYELMMRHIGPDAVSSPGRRANRYLLALGDPDAAMNAPHAEHLRVRQPVSLRPQDPELLEHPVVQDFQDWLEAGLAPSDPEDVMEEYLQYWRPDNRIYYDVLQRYLGQPETNGYPFPPAEKAPTPSGPISPEAEITYPPGYEHDYDDPAPGARYPDRREPLTLPDREYAPIREPVEVPPRTLMQQIFPRRRRSTVTRSFVAVAHDELYWAGRRL